MREEKQEMDPIPSADDVLDEMERTAAAECWKRVFRVILFWLFIAWLAGTIVVFFGYEPVRIVAAVLVIGILAIIIRVIAARRRYQLPDEAYED